MPSSLRFSAHLPGVLVLPEGNELRVAQVIIRRPLHELKWAHDKKVICSMEGSVKMLAPTVVYAVGLGHDQPYFSTPSSRRVVGGSVAAPADAPRLGQRTPDEMWASPLCLPTRSQGAARAVLHAHPGHGR